MQVLMSFRPHHLKLGPQHIKGRIRFVREEDEQQFLCHRWQLAFGTTARLACAGSRFDPFFIRFVLYCLVEVIEDG